MSFKEAINIEEISNIVEEIYENVHLIKEYGHCVIPSSEHLSLKERSEILLKKLKECENELSKMNSEITDWYSY